MAIIKRSKKANLAGARLGGPPANTPQRYGLKTRMDKRSTFTGYMK